MKKMFLGLFFIGLLGSAFGQQVEIIEVTDDNSSGGGELATGFQTYSFRSFNCDIEIEYFVSLNEQGNYEVKDVSLIQLNGHQNNGIYDSVWHGLKTFDFDSSYSRIDIYVDYTVKTKILMGPDINGMYYFRIENHDKRETIVHR